MLKSSKIDQLKSFNNWVKKKKKKKENSESVNSNKWHFLRTQMKKEMSIRMKAARSNSVLFSNFRETNRRRLT